MVGVTNVLIEWYHFLADGIDRGGVEFAGDGLDTTLDGLHGGGVYFDVIGARRGELEGGGFGVAVDVLRFPDVAVEVVVVYEGGHPVGGGGQATVLFGRLFRDSELTGGHWLVDLEVWLRRRRLILLHRRLVAEHRVLWYIHLVLGREHLVLRGQSLVLWGCHL